MNRKINVFIYTDHPSGSLSLNEIDEFLSAYGFNVSQKGDLFGAVVPDAQGRLELARKLSGCVVSDIETPLKHVQDGIHSDLGRELSIMERGSNDPGSVLYDGNWLQRILYTQMAGPLRAGETREFIDLIFTGRLFGTFQDKRYHARVVLLGEPSLLSTSGLVEAPARPREYYYIKGRLIQTGHDTAELDEIYRGRYVEYDDEKVSRIMRSYALQAVMYRMTGREFCDSPDCCLYNSHWQEEVLKVHYKSVPCRECEKILADYAGS